MSEGVRVGVDPISKVVMMEDHHEAFYAWKKAGVEKRILVHCDPHIDFNWILDQDPAEILHAATRRQVEFALKKRTIWNFYARPLEKTINIGNYIYPAIKEGIVREFYWVVPDGMTKRSQARNGLFRFFLNLRKIFPERVQRLRQTEGGVSCVLDGVPTAACSMEFLSPISEPVLLDIDTDFFIIPSFTPFYPHFDPENIEPWLRPSKLVERLRSKGLMSDFVTIAYSVEGGFTPLDYKYLGNELKSILQKMPHEDEAAFHFGEAKSCQRLGQLEEARNHYAKSVRKDSGYASAYNNFGRVYLSLNKLEKSQKAFKDILELDPENPYALIGLGSCFARQKKLEEASLCYGKALEIKNDLEEARYSLAFLWFRKGLYQKAMALLEERGNFEEYKIPVYLLKGFLFRKMARWDEAILAYEAVFRGGGAGFIPHFHLAILYLRKKRFYKAWRRFQTAIRRFPYYITKSLWRYCLLAGQTFRNLNFRQPLGG